MSAARANQPKALKFLTLNNATAEEPQRDSSEQMDSTVSFEGFEIKTDPQISKLKGKSWADIGDSSSCTTSAFNTPFDAAREPQFTSPAIESVKSSASPFAVESNKKVPSDIDDGCEDFADEEELADVSNGLSTPPPLNEQEQYQDAFYEDYQQEDYSQEAPRRPVIPPQPRYNGMLAPRDASQVANPELIGWLPFIEYTSQALDTELPTAAQFGDAHAYGVTRPQKMFFGHLWSRLPTGSIQWLLDALVRNGPNKVYGAQLHFNKEGWFRGCLHASVITPSAHEVMYRLHKRVLFDHTGIWYAETDDQMVMLEEYCRRLRQMPQHLRHQKLQSLPCNPVACELARNEH